MKRLFVSCSLREKKILDELTYSTPHIMQMKSFHLRLLTEDIWQLRRGLTKDNSHVTTQGKFLLWISDFLILNSFAGSSNLFLSSFPFELDFC